MMASGHTILLSFIFFHCIVLTGMITLSLNSNYRTNDHVDYLSIPQRFVHQNISTLTHHESHGAVFMLNDGTRKTILKSFPTSDSFEHSLYIQQIIQQSEYRDITVNMIDFDRTRRWIQYECGIHLRRKNQTDRIHDLEQQLMNIHGALQSLGIIHNDVLTKNFLLSTGDLQKIIIFDFGSAIVWRDIHLLFNRHHMKQIWDRVRSVMIRGRKPSFFDEADEFKNVYGHFRARKTYTEGFGTYQD